MFRTMDGDHTTGPSDQQLPQASPDAGSFTLSGKVETVSNPSGSTAESYRALRTHIMAQHVHEGRRALAVCAPTAGVGVTFVASNLAVALSQIGVKTLLVDVNLRQPKIDQLFRPQAPVLGLTQCLSTDDPDFPSFIQEEVLPNLSIMFSGAVSTNPQELLASDRFAELMEYCLRQFDLTIVDTPPANSCSDVHRISTVVGYSLIVTRRDRTLVSDVQTLIRQLEIDGARVVGTVLTEV
jgi:protein-tyrosine kinase